VLPPGFGDGDRDGDGDGGFGDVPGDGDDGFGDVEGGGVSGHVVQPSLVQRQAPLSTTSKLLPCVGCAQRFGIWVCRAME
jgi:hypothetical protein